MYVFQLWSKVVMKQQSFKAMGSYLGPQTSKDGPAVYSKTA